MHVAKLQMVWQYTCKLSIMPLKCIKLKDERQKDRVRQREKE